MSQSRIKQMPQCVFDIIPYIAELKSFYAKEGLLIDMEIDGLRITEIDRIEQLQKQVEGAER